MIINEQDSKLIMKTFLEKKVANIWLQNMIQNHDAKEYFEVVNKVSKFEIFKLKYSIFKDMTVAISIKKVNILMRRTIFYNFYIYTKMLNILRMKREKTWNLT